MVAGLETCAKLPLLAMELLLPHLFTLQKRVKPCPEHRFHQPLALYECYLSKSSIKLVGVQLEDVAVLLRVMPLVWVEEELVVSDYVNEQLLDCIDDAMRTGHGNVTGDERVKVDECRPLWAGWILCYARRLQQRVWQN